MSRWTNYVVEINTDNAAFSDGAVREEIASILRRLAERLEDRWQVWPSVLLDTNGNSVGRCAMVRR